MKISVEENMLPYTNTNSDTPLYLQIVNQLRDMILNGELPDGFKIPSERRMAELLGVHRNTIKRAYNELKADAYLTSIERKGFVVSNAKEPPCSSFRNYGLLWNDLIRDEYLIHRIETHFSSWLKHDVNYSFSGDLFLAEEPESADISRLLMDLANSADPNKYTISHKQGMFALRKSIANFARLKGINANPGEIQIVSESFQAIEYISNLLLQKGDSVIIEEPVCPEIFRIFLSIGARVITVDMDENGLVCEHLESLIIKHHPKIIYTNPDFQNPTGTVMSLERRKELLSLSYRYSVPVIEEDACSGFRYDNSPLPSLKALDQHECVIYVHSFYYALPSGIRIAFIIGNQRLISDISAIIQSRIVCADVISQQILHQYLEQALYQRNLAKMCREYQIKRNLMFDALEPARSLGIQMRKPDGGLYLWLCLPQNMSLRKLSVEANKRDVSFMPGNMFFLKGSKGENYIRLNYSIPPADKITLGIPFLNEAFSESLL